LNRLAAVIKTNLVEDAGGGLSVFTASGAPLVLGVDAARLTTIADATTGLDGAPLSAVAVRTGNGPAVRVHGELGGTLGALVSLRDGIPPARAADLDVMATCCATR